jgi:hypothetical protein
VAQRFTAAIADLFSAAALDSLLKRKQKKSKPS